MADNFLDPFGLDLAQREAAHREQLRRQQPERELQLTNNPPAEPSDCGPQPRQDQLCSSPPTGEAVPARPAKAANDIRLNYHSPQCTICNHPEREEIDRAILHWYSPTAIAREFHLPDRRIVYRHAHALGLFLRRAKQSRHSLGFLIERAQTTVPTADAVIRAVRALSCIDDRGQWHEPRKEVIITHRYENAMSRSGNQQSTPDSQDALPAPPHNHPPRRRQSPHRTQQRAVSGRQHIERNSSSHSFTPPAPRKRQDWSRPPAAAGFKRPNWSTRLLSKIRHKYNSTNKTQKIGRHTFRSGAAFQARQGADRNPACPDAGRERGNAGPPRRVDEGSLPKGRNAD